MKVMFVVHRMHPNLREVYRALISYGHQCIFVVAGVGPSEPDVFEDRILVHPHVLSDAAVNEILDHDQPDLVVQRNIDGPYVLFWKIARERGIPQVLYTQDPHQVPLFDAFVRPLRVIRLFRDLVIQRIKLGPHKRITPVKYWGREPKLSFSHSEYLPFPAVINSSKTESVSGPLTVLTVAKHGQRRKRVRWLLKALKQASAPFTLIVVGASPSPSDKRKQKNYSQFVRLIRKLGERAENVIVHENLDREEIEALYTASDVFALPSKRELMAISPLEAMSHGLPVLASSDGGAASYIDPAGSDQIFRARSYRDFRKKLFRLLEDEGLRRKLSAQAIKQLELTHSTKAFVDYLVKLATTEISK